MRGLGTIFRRELAGLFLSPLAWILFCLTLAYNAFFFLHYLRGVTGGEVISALGLLLGGGWPYWFLMMLLPPLLTMRMISEEARNGVLEFLLTAPVGDAAVVGGKALAATAFMALVFAAGPLFGAVTGLLGAPPDWGAVATAWLGSVLVSAVFCALGLVASALSATPLVAAFLATVTSVLWVFLPLAGRSVRGFSHPVTRWAIEKIDLTAHFQGSFQTGALDSAHVIFFLAWTLAFLFVAVRVVEAKRWL